MLDDARARLRRLTATEAAAAQRAGAVVVDIRPAAQREAEGGPDGVLVVERNVLAVAAEVPLPPGSAPTRAQSAHPPREPARLSQHTNVP